MYNQIEKNEELKKLSSQVSKLLKEKFGKGPESCSAFEGEGYITFYIRKFTSPMENVLVQQGEVNLALRSRNIIVDSILTELKKIMEQAVNTDIRKIYHDWNYELNTGILNVVLSQGELTNHSFLVKEQLESKIIQINKLKNKLPKRTESIQIDSNLYLVKCSGFVLPIEKMLIDKGDTDLLLDMESIFKAHYFRHIEEFEMIFQKGVADLFIHWDYHNDESFVCFILK
ncbi:Na-translocating system protein MpsC family protein [Tepidibacillus marianensis]|uniref:Na-translocating system protein MpsC family protein n=1 Tax=Tepidibacillus marianensis TaxID=3131995 RepID=UPI0030D1ACC3